jgi:ABC-type sugar transport system ATPase subunit
VRVVWQDLALSESLDVAANLMLGNERRRHLFSEVALHKDAARLLERLDIPMRETTRPVRLLSGGQRQMVAVARAMAHNPRLLLLDEPTASLAGREAALVERLITRLRAQGSTILLSPHDTELMFRLADRIVVLRHGRVVTSVLPSEVHPDDVVALVSGQPVDSSALYRDLDRIIRRDVHQAPVIGVDLHRLGGPGQPTGPDERDFLVHRQFGQARVDREYIFRLPLFWPRPSDTDGSLSPFFEAEDDVPTIDRQCHRRAP